MSLSRVVSATKRRNDLGTLFVNLLQDESRWVRMAAFQALGPFISTFSRLESELEGASQSASESALLAAGELSAESASEEVEPMESDFNSFYFWRDPLPELNFIPTTSIDQELLTSSSYSLSLNEGANVPNDSGSCTTTTTTETETSESVSDSVEKALEDLMARVELGNGSADGIVSNSNKPPTTTTSSDESTTIQLTSGSNELAEPVHAFDLRRVACQELLGATPSAVSSDPASGSATESSTTSTETNDLSADSLKSDTPVDETEQQQSASLLSSSITTSLATVMSPSSSLFQPNLILPPAYVKSSNGNGSTTSNNSISSTITTNTNTTNNSNNDLPTTVYSNSFCPYYSPRRRSDGGSMSGGGILESSRSRPYSPYSSSSMRSSISLSQSVVPQNLMDYYLQMTDPYYVETVDADITRHCAYSLPAVVCTLGKEHWPLLRDLYTTLASDMQWKVRRTLASSIHEIGAILGQDAVTQDLLPAFDGFIKDLDEVRIGVLKHLSDFLRLLPEKERRSYLPRLADFLKLDNEQNWRFRQELALQLQSVVGLFSPAESAQSILPLALTLASDRVAAVRLPAFTLVSLYFYFPFSLSTVRILEPPQGERHSPSSVQRPKF